jgi:hypothetical protein
MEEKRPDSKKFEHQWQKQVMVVDPDVFLSDLLRDQLKLTGTKIGCGQGPAQRNDGKRTGIQTAGPRLSFAIPGSNSEPGSVLNGAFGLDFCINNV